MTANSADRRLTDCGSKNGCDRRADEWGGDTAEALATLCKEGCTDDPPLSGPSVALYFPGVCRCGSLECREEAVPERCPCYRSWPFDNIRPDRESGSEALTDAA